MVDYMEILRLSSDPKNSQRCIASIVHSSRHTIRDVLEAAKKAGVSWPLDDTVTNEMLKRILFPEKSTAETLYTQPVLASGVPSHILSGITDHFLSENWEPINEFSDCQQPRLANCLFLRCHRLNSLNLASLH